MRYVTVQPDGIKEQPGGAEVTGSDDETGELVTFSASMTEAAAIKARNGALIPVDNEDVIRVVSAGEWDSPGTSPEES